MYKALFWVVFYILYGELHENEKRPLFFFLQFVVLLCIS